MEKVNTFYESVIDILAWAVQQGHINEEQMTLLAQNIATAKDNIAGK